MNPNRLLAASLALFVSACDNSPVEPQPAEQLPSWLLGTYERGTPVENSVSVEAAQRAVRFEEGNHYRFRDGQQWSAVQYDVSVTEHSVFFESGPLHGKQLALSSVSPNCRIVKLDGDALYRADGVADCPMSSRTALTARSCDVVGTWRKTTRQGPIENSLEVAITAELQPDHFFKTSTSTVRCTNGDCRYDEGLPAVGTWSEVDGALVGPDVVGFEHMLSSECALMVARAPEVINAMLFTLPNVSVVPFDPPPARAYGSCTQDSQCTGQCGDFGACTSICKYDVECGSPGDGMVASCRSNRCMATCATGNACPVGTVCRDGLCL